MSLYMKYSEFCPKHKNATDVHVRKIIEASENVYSELHKRLKTPTPLSVTINEQPFTQRLIDIKTFMDDTLKVVHIIAKLQKRKRVVASCVQQRSEPEINQVSQDHDDVVEVAQVPSSAHEGNQTPQTQLFELFVSESIFVKSPNMTDEMIIAPDQQQQIQQIARTESEAVDGLDP
ncbi:hypothetical protein L6452_18140 [Arctium lappa]|uniref:Uncharacterized protein n=1 Tax=Arctium lappa TaxID=4217 RepID=A0ACB9C5I4_ARCLA|nr:hypothetical protein L6452_18140 [Arctium lappa]